GIRDFHVTGVQTCALPIFDLPLLRKAISSSRRSPIRHRSASHSAMRRWMAGVVRPWLWFQTFRNSGKPISSSIASSEELRQKPERQPAEGADEAGERGDEAAVARGHALVDEIEAGAELGMRRPHLLLKGEQLAVLPLGPFAALPLVTVERRFRRGPRRAERRAHGGFLQ